MCHDVYILDLRCVWYAGGQTAPKRRKRQAVFFMPGLFFRRPAYLGFIVFPATCLFFFRPGLP
ncbi:hypothetical protein NEIELOOT_01270 [Neisseria elongata subsp. glycolytica ATCC 29315]|uniref:Uncharacterized protein n=1 Tax=Neisseria elongata subsp. glycolytica ATCC 29315 TaxID=546263 RepID=D4DQD4_NEIEG|nr:hypothetical protein NEIELOOT_01270 [Neisseria elongata subsp. glycolytica ATCC 29315]